MAKAATTPEPDGGNINTQVTREVPDITVIVKEGNEVSHGGTHFLAGEEVTMDGPTAWQLFLNGHVTIKGEVA